MAAPVGHSDLRDDNSTSSFSLSKGSLIERKAKILAAGKLIEAAITMLQKEGPITSPRLSSPCRLPSGEDALSDACLYLKKAEICINKALQNDGETEPHRSTSMGSTSSKPKKPSSDTNLAGLANNPKRAASCEMSVLDLVGFKG